MSIVRAIKDIIKNVTSFAIKMGYIDNSPISLVTLKVIEKEKKEILNIIKSIIKFKKD